MSIRQGSVHYGLMCLAKELEIYPVAIESKGKGHGREQLECYFKNPSKR